MSLIEARLKWQQAKTTGEASGSLAGVVSPERGSRVESHLQAEADLFHCLLCQQQHHIQQRFYASTCGHSFCRSGAKEVALTAIRASRIPILCPQCTRTNVCSIIDEDVQELLDASEQQEYVAANLSAAGVGASDITPVEVLAEEVLVECPFCESWTAVPAGNCGLPRATCSSCQHFWCQQCCVPWHTKMSCAEYLVSVEDVKYCKSCGKRDVGTSGPCLSCEEEELRKLQKTFAEEDKHIATLAQRQEVEDLRLAREQAALLDAEDRRKARRRAAQLEARDLEFARQQAVQLAAEEQELAAVRAAARAAEQTFKCAICMDEHPMEECFISSMCGHCVCKEAARGIALLAIKECSLPMECSLCKATPCSECAEKKAAGERYWCCTLDADIQDLLTDEERTQYLDMSLKAASNTSQDLAHCVQPDCKGLAVYGNDNNKLVCNLCNHEWCASCGVPWHYNKTCQEVKDALARTEGEAKADKEFESYQQQNRMIICPTCRHALMKISGCNRIVCGSCRSQVCWLCAALLDRHNPYGHYKQGGACKGKTYS